MSGNVSRTKNTTLNFISSALAQVTAILLSFISRTVFVKTLGVGYLGINGLFVNIISVLSLAELGVGSAIIYSMYKPIAENDTDRIAALIGYYRKLYIYIAVIVTIIGLFFFAFLDFFINLDTDIPNIKYYYLLFLAQAVSSYLIVYRTSILTADQRKYLITKTSIIGNFISVILQILVLIVTQNYILYTIVQIVVGLFVNYINSRVAVKFYPYILKKVELSVEEKKSIWFNIKSMFSYKIGGVILNNTDNMLISKLVSTTFLGIYSNYSLIIDKVAGIVNLIFTSLQTSLGNYNAENKSSNMYFMFKTISMIEYWIYVFCSVSFCLILNDFIILWLGEEYTISMIVIYICVLNFYIKGILYPIWCFRNTTGLFKDAHFIMYIAAGINLSLSILLGVKFGMIGILGATAIARICTNVWYEPRILFSKYFNEDVKKYYVIEIIRFVQLAAIIVLSQIVFNLLRIEQLGIRLICKVIYCCIVPNAIIFFESVSKDEFKYVLDKISIFTQKKHKR